MHKHDFLLNAACNKQCNKRMWTDYICMSMHADFITAYLRRHSELCKVLFLALSVVNFFILSVSQVSPELLNRFAPNSPGVFGPSLGRVWMSRSKAKVTGAKNALCTPITSRQQRNGPVCCMQRVPMHCQRSGLHVVYVWKTSLL